MARHHNLVKRTTKMHAFLKFYMCIDIVPKMSHLGKVFLAKILNEYLIAFYIGKHMIHFSDFIPYVQYH